MSMIEGVARDSLLQGENISRIELKTSSLSAMSCAAPNVVVGSATKLRVCLVERHAVKEVRMQNAR